MTLRYDSIAEVPARLRGEVARRLGERAPKGGRWSAEKPTEGDGRKFPALLPALVYRSLQEEYPGAEILHEVRFPLLTLGVGTTGQPLYFRPDFVVLPQDLPRWMSKAVIVEAKGRRRSRDYELRKRAFEASYSVRVEERER